MTMSLLRGRLTLIFLRLCVLAPRMLMNSIMAKLQSNRFSKESSCRLFSQAFLILVFCAVILFTKPQHVFARDCFTPPENATIVKDDDNDGDGIKNLSDNCPNIINADQNDANHDGIGDTCDKDTDGFPDQCDNCLSLSNPDQIDDNANGVGDACEIKLGKIKKPKEKIPKAKSEPVYEDFNEFKDDQNDQFELNDNEDEAPIDIL